MIKIGMSTYSLRKNFDKGNFDFNDFSFMNREFPHIEGLEVLTGQMDKFLDDTEIDDVKSLKERIEKAGLELFSITTDSGYFLSNSVPHYRPFKEYIEGFKPALDMRIDYVGEWIDIASKLGIKFMRVDGKPFFYNHKIPIHRAIDFNLEQDIQCYQEFTRLAKKSGITLSIENHGGFYSDLKVLKRLFDEVPDLKLCYDVGNLPDDYRYSIIDEFGDRIGFVHAKTYEFDENGNERNFDFKEVITKLKDNGFGKNNDGWLSIEFEGSSDEIEGVKKTMNLLKNLLN
ncbi:MAG: sugar phosphate isomerase/epimerase family protein [Promethearchaeota archaeon]